MYRTKIKVFITVTYESAEAPSSRDDYVYADAVRKAVMAVPGTKSYSDCGTKILAFTPPPLENEHGNTASTTV
jgi:hypothetical protein